MQRAESGEVQREYREGRGEIQRAEVITHCHRYQILAGCIEKEATAHSVLNIIFTVFFTLEFVFKLGAFRFKVRFWIYTYAESLNQN